MSSLEVKGSPIEQASGESQSYEADFATNRGATSLSSLDVAVFDITGMPPNKELDSGQNVTSTVMPSGSASESAGVLTAPRLTLLTVGHTYAIRFRGTDQNSNVQEAFLVVKCTRDSDA
jgi:hypothetical protein